VHVFPIDLKCVSSKLNGIVKVLVKSKTATNRTCVLYINACISINDNVSQNLT
jgi:hypothetical protein